MNTIIRQIIDADKDARLKVAHAKEQLKKSKSIFNEQSLDIKNQFDKSALEAIADKERVLERNYQEHLRLMNASYTDSCSKLESQFASNRDKWINDIIRRCFDL